MTASQSTAPVSVWKINYFSDGDTVLHKSWQRYIQYTKLNLKKKYK